MRKTINKILTKVQCIMGNHQLGTLEYVSKYFGHDWKYVLCSCKHCGTIQAIKKPMVKKDFVENVVELSLAEEKKKKFEPEQLDDNDPEIIELRTKRETMLKKAIKEGK